MRDTFSDLLLPKLLNVGNKKTPVGTVKNTLPKFVVSREKILLV